MIRLIDKQPIPEYSDPILKEIYESPEFNKLKSACETRGYEHASLLLYGANKEWPIHLTSNATDCVPLVLATAKIAQKGSAQAGIILDGKTEGNQIMNQIPGEYRTHEVGGFVNFDARTMNAVGIETYYMHEAFDKIAKLSEESQTDVKSTHSMILIMKALRAGYFVGINPTRTETTGVPGRPGLHAMIIVGEQYENGKYGFIIFDPDKEYKGKLFYPVEDLIKWNWDKNIGITPSAIPSGSLLEWKDAPADRKPNIHSIAKSDTVSDLSENEELTLENGALRVIPKPLRKVNTIKIRSKNN